MSVLKRRSRMISFRISEDEYAGWKNLCINLGARSVSDMARDAVQRLITHTSPNNYLETAVQDLQHKVEVLDSEVKRLDMVLNTQKPARSIGARSGDGDD